jgi:ferrochelatase
MADPSSETILRPETSAARPQRRLPAARGCIAVLLVNLGTPDAANAAGIRRYLREFLSDKRVIENQGLAWKLALNGVILPLRPARKARDYLKIWNKENDESPLKTVTRSQAQKLGSSLAALDKGISVDWAMRYGNPSIADRVNAFMGQGCERLLVIPLYPQYCAATTATVCDELFRTLMRLRYQPGLRIAPPYYDDSVYIEALASSTEAALANLDFEPELILASFHGTPQAYIDSGDPYRAHCEETMRLLRLRLGRDDANLRLAYQSRFGRDKWLEPATIEMVADLAKEGVRSIAVITPGFSADCLETLEEIAVENADVFRRNGGENFAAIPCLNDSDAGMRVIRQLALRELKGWI